MLSLHKLEIFNTVAQEGSFSRAAERLLLTQPAVSQHIRDLESTLGKALFQRGNRGVALTPAGELLVDYTRCILRMLAEAESAVASLSERASGSVSLGVTPGAGVYLLPAWIQSFRQRYPDITTVLRTDTTARIAEEVLKGGLELGLIEGELEPELPLRVLTLRDIELLVVVGAGHPWWDRSEVPLAALDGQAFIARLPGSHTRSWTEQLFSQNGIAPDIVAEFDNPEAIKRAVAAGLGISLLPDWSLSKEPDGGRIRGLPIRGATLHRTLKLLWSENQPFKMPAQAFLLHLTEEYPVLHQVLAFYGVASSALPKRSEYRASLICNGKEG